MKDIILGLLRHLLTAGGGVLAAKGVVGADDAATLETAIGSAVALAGAAWSIWDKKKQKSTPVEPPKA